MDGSTPSTYGIGSRGLESSRQLRWAGPAVTDLSSLERSSLRCPDRASGRLGGRVTGAGTGATVLLSRAVTAQLGGGATALLVGVVLEDPTIPLPRSPVLAAFLSRSIRSWSLGRFVPRCSGSAIGFANKNSWLAIDEEVVRYSAVRRCRPSIRSPRVG